MAGWWKRSHWTFFEKCIRVKYNIDVKFFMIKKFTKNLLVLFIFAAIVGGVFYLLQKKGGQNPKNAPEIINAEAVLQEIQELEFWDATLSPEAKEKYQKQFDTFLPELREAMAEVKNRGKEAEPLLYWPVFNIGNVHREAGNYSRARNAYLLAHQLQPNAFPPLGNLGELYNRYLKEYAKAEEYYLKAIEIDSPYTEQYYSDLYEIYRFRMKDEKKAEEFLLSGIKKYPKKFDIIALLALHYRQLGNIEKARETYRKLLEANPESIAAKQGLEELNTR